MRSELRNINTRIGFSNCIPPVAYTSKTRNTMHGQFIVSSPLSFHLNPIEDTTKIKSNIVLIEKPLCTGHLYQALPRLFIDKKLVIVPKQNYLHSINMKNRKTYLIGTRHRWADKEERMAFL